MAALLHFSKRGRLPVLHQTEAAECGLACLAMVAWYYGHRIDLNTLRRRHPVSLKGVTLRGLIQVANQMHLGCRAIRFELAHLRHLRLPAIVHWDMNHFVVLKSVTRRGIEIHDPAAGERFFVNSEASKHLMVLPLSSLHPKVFYLETKEGGFLFRHSGISWQVAPTLLLSVILELFVIASPFYLQVEAQDAESPGTWVPLGNSSGITQSFSLAAAHLKAALAFRIIDTSGRRAMRP